MIKVVSCLFLLLFSVVLAKSQVDSSYYAKDSLLLEQLALQEDWNTLSAFVQKKERELGANFPQAILPYLHHYLKLLSTAGRPSELPAVLLQLSDYTFTSGDFGKAVTLAERADSLFQVYPNDSLYLRLLFRLAEGYEYTARPEQGAATLEKCYLQATQLKDTLMLARLEVKLGNIYQIDGLWADALRSYQEAARRLDPEKPDMQTLYFSTEQEYYDLLLECWVQIPDSTKVEVKGKINLLTDKVRSLKTGDGMVQAFEELQLRLAILQQDEDALKQAKLKSIAALRLETTNPGRLCNKLNLHARLALHKGLLEHALEFTDTSFQIALKNQSIGLKSEALETKKEVTRRLKRYKEQVTVMDSLLHYRDVLTHANRQSSIQRLGDRLEKKEKELELTRLEAEQTALKLSNLRYISSVGILLVLAFSLLLIVVSVRRKNHLIQKQNYIISNRNLQLETLDASRNQLLKVFAHEVRKPVQAFNDIARKVNYLLKKNDIFTLLQIVDQIESDTRSLRKLTENLLHWTLSQEEHLPKNIREVELEDILSDVIEVYKAQALKKGIRFQSHIPPKSRLSIDPAGLRLIVINLLDNALKFTPKGGEVHMEFIDEKNSKLLTVRDSGRGMTQEQLDQLFQETVVESLPGTEGEVGIGVGLPLVRELTVFYGGTIDVHSSIGHGTRFLLKF